MNGLMRLVWEAFARAVGPILDTPLAKLGERQEVLEPSCPVCRIHGDVGLDEMCKAHRAPDCQRCDFEEDLWWLYATPRIPEALVPLTVAPLMQPTGATPPAGATPPLQSPGGGPDVYQILCDTTTGDEFATWTTD